MSKGEILLTTICPSFFEAVIATLLCADDLCPIQLLKEVREGTDTVLPKLIGFVMGVDDIPFSDRQTRGRAGGGRSNRRRGGGGVGGRVVNLTCRCHACPGAKLEMQTRMRGLLHRTVEHMPSNTVLIKLTVQMDRNIIKRTNLL